MATLRVAAPRQIQRGRKPGEPLRLHRDDLRQKVREHKVGSLVVFLIDGSASMAAQERMAMTKTVILSLLHDAYVAETGWPQSGSAAERPESR